jgi:Bacterial SH3 domain
MPRRRSVWRWGAVILLVLLPVACSPGGDDDDEPTATPPALPGDAAASPAPASPTAPEGSAVAETAPPSPPATRETPEGRTPTGEADASPAPRVGGRTPTPRSIAVAASPTAADEPGETAFEVDSCTPDEESLPQPRFRTAVINDDGVNLRDGPGTDCETVGSLDTGADVTLLSGPVVRADQDEELIWVLIRVEENNAEVWVAQSFVERP